MTKGEIITPSFYGSLSLSNFKLFQLTLNGGRIQILNIQSEITYTPYLVIVIV